MIYSLSGKLMAKKESWLALDINGVCFEIKAPFYVVKSLPEIGALVRIFTYLHVREDALELYGFLTEAERRFFEMLISISGIGPKSALGIMGVEKLDNLKAAISEGRSELLTKASGVGRKTAERVVLELRGRLEQEGARQIVGVMESDQDIIEALANLGYTKGQARDVLAKVNPKIIKMEERVKEALRLLKSR